MDKFILLFLCIVICTEAKVVEYNFTANYKCGAPDGITKCTMLVANGQFPGPTINATVGDFLSVTVHNEIDPAVAGPLGTTIHWHGLLQRGTPFEDGAEMINQCPIPYNQTQVYKFKLKQWGTYWWHAHSHWQYTDGFWGPLIIHNKVEVYKGDYDHEFVVTLNDWYHKSGPENTKHFLSECDLLEECSFGVPPFPDSVMLNGRGWYPCLRDDLNSTENKLCDPSQQTPYVFNVKRGKRYRVRFINTSAISNYVVCIADHILEVIEVDGVDTVKKSFDCITIAPAQRYSAIVTMNGINDQYYINAWVVTPISLFMPLNLIANMTMAEKEAMAKQQELPISGQLAQGVLNYEGEGQEDRSFQFNDKIELTSSELQAIDESRNEIRFPGEDELYPYDQIFAPEDFDEQITLTTELLFDEEKVFRQTFDGINYQPGVEPILASVLLNRTIPTNAHAFYTGYNKVIQLVINNPEIIPHPIHLHGHHFWVVGAGAVGNGNYDPNIHQLLKKGVKRDTHTVLSKSFLVIRFISNNPGVWYIHCHINWHLQAGMAAVVIEAPEEMRKRFQVTPEARRICHLSGIHI